MTFVKCTTCNNQKAKYKLWQNSKNKFEKFCSFDCLKIYCRLTYKRLGGKAYGLAKDIVEEL